MFHLNYFFSEKYQMFFYLLGSYLLEPQRRENGMVILRVALQIANNETSLVSSAMLRTRQMVKGK